AANCLRKRGAVLAQSVRAIVKNHGSKRREMRSSRRLNSIDQHERSAVGKEDIAVPVLSAVRELDLVRIVGNAMAGGVDGQSSEDIGAVNRARRILGAVGSTGTPARRVIGVAQH